MLAARTPQPDGPWHGQVAVAGGHLPICMAGDGAPLILLHGWTLDHRMWAPQVAGLATDFFLVMPDRRGCGASTAPSDLAREADDIIAIADALGFERFALAGLSQGAVVALDVARKFASRLTGLVVSGAPLPALVERQEVIDIDRFRALAAAGDLERLRVEWSRNPLMETHTSESRALMLDILADYDGRDLLSHSHAPGFPREAAALLAMPVLAMTGAHDTLWRRECARVLATLAPRGRHLEIPAAGHLANADNPAAFNAAIAAFLKPKAPK